MNFSDLTEERKKMLIEGINEEIDIPVLPEKFEGMMFELIIDQLCKFLDEHLPQRVIESIFDAAMGVFGGQDDVEKAVTRFTKIIHDRVDIWWIPDKHEQRFYEVLLQVFFYFAQEGVDLVSADKEQIKKAARS